MAAPTITSATLNKSAYAPGEIMILTVVGADADEEMIEITLSVRSRATGATSVPVVVPTILDELQTVATDSGTRTWTQIARTGATFVLTSVA
ncbi:hypothetical protein OG792_21620 [Micromonospora sp. NBC_01699]|uniref:hypothetical protein n=1 Tax=Micromonospora sp. NBC_01699 TaxID=2975984 RepID=UPI002E2E5C57|nr:hypothetical protein [Micromonospora sp. NBC_01699]